MQFEEASIRGPAVALMVLRPAARGPELPTHSNLKWEPQESVSGLSPASRQDILVLTGMSSTILIKDVRGIWASVAVAEIITDVVEVVHASASARSHQ